MWGRVASPAGSYLSSGIFATFSFGLAANWSRQFEQQNPILWPWYTNTNRSDAGFPDIGQSALTMADLALSAGASDFGASTFGVSECLKPSTLARKAWGSASNFALHFSQQKAIACPSTTLN